MGRPLSRALAGCAQSRRRPYCPHAHHPWRALPQYDLEGRSARYHKEQIRQWTGFRVGTTADADAITTWLCAHTRVDEATPPRLTVRALERYKALHIEASDHQDGWSG